MPKTFKQIIDSVNLAAANVNAGKSPWDCNPIIGWRELAEESKKTFDCLFADVIFDRDGRYVGKQSVVVELMVLSRVCSSALILHANPVESDDDLFREKRELDLFNGYMHL